MTRFAIAIGCTFLVLLSSAAGIAAAYPLATEYPATLKGEQVAQHVFTFEGGMTAKCPVMIAHGKVSAAEEDFDLDPEYNGTFEQKCTAFGLAGTASISMNGCVYRLAPETAVGAGETTGTLSIICPEGQKITITSGTCEVQIGEQANAGSVGFVNELGEASEDDVEIDLDLEKTLDYNKTKDGSGCPLAGTGLKTDGSLDGLTTLTAFDPETKAQQPLSVGTGSFLAAGAYPATLRGAQSGLHTFTFETKRTVECPSATFHKEISGPISPLRLPLELSGVKHPETTTSCNAEKIPTWGSVSVNGCEFRLSMPFELKEGKTTGEADLLCPSGASMVFKWANCEVRVGDEGAEGKLVNQNLGPVTFVNQPKSEPEKDSVSVAIEIKEELAYKKTKDGFTCGLDGASEEGVEVADGSYVGTLILTGQKPGTEEPFDVFLES